MDKEISKKGPFIFGAVWGALMFVFDLFLDPFISSKPHDFSFNKILISIVVWTIGGIGMAFVTRYFQNRKLNKSK